MYDIGCIILASGLSTRYGKNKLLEPLGDREVILHTITHAQMAGLIPLTVTRSPDVKALIENAGFSCIMHERPLKSDTIHIGIEALTGDLAGFLFMQADQPLILPETIKRMVLQFRTTLACALRLGYAGVAGSPVLFPFSLKDDLLAYQGDRGGMEVLKRLGFPCETMEAAHEWEMWDVDTPERMKSVRDVYARIQSQKIV